MRDINVQRDASWVSWWQLQPQIQESFCMTVDSHESRSARILQKCLDHWPFLWIQASDFQCHWARWLHQSNLDAGKRKTNRPTSQQSKISPLGLQVLVPGKWVNNHRRFRRCALKEATVQNSVGPQVFNRCHSVFQQFSNGFSTVFHWLTNGFPIGPAGFRRLLTCFRWISNMF